MLNILNDNFKKHSNTEKVISVDEQMIPYKVFLVCPSICPSIHPSVRLSDLPTNEIVAEDELQHPFVRPSSIQRSPASNIITWKLVDAWSFAFFLDWWLQFSRAPIGANFRNLWHTDWLTNGPNDWPSDQLYNQPTDQLATGKLHFNKNKFCFSLRAGFPWKYACRVNPTRGELR